MSSGVGRGSEKGKRALVLGGGGMLGRAVAAEWRRRGDAVLALSRAQADVTAPGTVRHWIEEFRPEVVVNCAAFTRVDDCEVQRNVAWAVNASGAGTAAETATRNGARFLHVSTDYVFDGRGTSPYPVDHPTAPISEYGRSKLEGERRVLALSGTAVVRTSWLFGPGGPNFVRAILGQLDKRRMANDTTPLRVVGDQVGCPTYTHSLARALWELARREATGVHHFSNRDPVSWHGFAREIVRGAGSQLEVVAVTTAEFPRPAPRPAYSVLDVSGFEDTVGHAVEPWICGLHDYQEHLRRNVS